MRKSSNTSQYDINKKTTKFKLKFNSLFKKNVYYNKELERRTKLPYFILSHKVVIIMLFLVIPLVLLGLFILCRIYECTKWFDLVSTYFAYLGTVFIGLAAYYFSWIQINKNRKDNKIQVSLFTLPKTGDNNKCDSFYTREEALKKVNTNAGLVLANTGYNYIEMIITNTNPHTTLKITPKKAFASFSKNRSEACDEILHPNFLFTKENHFFKFDEQNTMYLGIDQKYLNKDIDFVKIFILFEVINIDGDSSYMLCTCRGNNQFLDSDVCLVTSKLLRLIGKYGTSVLNDVSMYKKVNGDWVSLLDLYKS